MPRALFAVILFPVWLILAAASLGPKVSILIDLDPHSAAQTVIVESIAADSKGMLYVCDRVSGNVWRIDPKNPKLVVVGKVEEREVAGKKVKADASGIVFNQEGDLFIASGPFKEVLRIRNRSLDPDKPGVAQTFATNTEGANGVAFDSNGNLYVSGGRNGLIYRTGREGGKAQVVAQITAYTRTLPDGKTQQAITANGLVFDAQGTALYGKSPSAGMAGQSSLRSSHKVRCSKERMGPLSIPTAIFGLRPTSAMQSLWSHLTGKFSTSLRTAARGPWSFPQRWSSSMI